MWVLYSLVESGMLVYDMYVRSLTEDERAALWDDYKVVGKLFGLRKRDMPGNAGRLPRLRRGDARERPPGGDSVGP